MPSLVAGNSALELRLVAFVTVIVFAVEVCVKAKISWPKNSTNAGSTVFVQTLFALRAIFICFRI